MLGAAELPATDPDQAAAGLAELDALLEERVRPVPMVRLVEERVLAELAQDELFSGRVGRDVGAAITTTIRYLAHCLDQPRPFMRADFGEEPVVEQHLADDYGRWLYAAPLAGGGVAVEVREIAAGRADVLISFGTHRVVVELKRELEDATHEALESGYGAQAASYQATDYPFGIALVLDLSAEQDVAAAHLEDLVWVSRAAPDGRHRWLVWCLVPGRRVSPSALSR